MSKSTSKLFSEENDNKLTKALNEAAEKEILEEKNVPIVPETSDDDIQDVEIKAVKKQRFRFNHDNSMILELNISDLTIITRLTSSYNKLNHLMDEVSKLLSDMPDEPSESDFDNISEALKKLDDNMRKELDYIFDAPVSDVLGRDGSMYDPIDGMFRYEHIIDVLASKYENNLSREFSKMRQRVEHSTSKYTKKYHK